MALKTSKNLDESTILSFSAAHSPYNLRRNLSQRGGITIRNSPLRSKKNFYNVNAPLVKVLIDEYSKSTHEYSWDFSTHQ